MSQFEFLSFFFPFSQNKILSTPFLLAPNLFYHKLFPFLISKPNSFFPLSPIFLITHFYQPFFSIFFFFLSQNTVFGSYFSYSTNIIFTKCFHRNFVYHTYFCPHHLYLIQICVNYFIHTRTDI